MFWLTDIFLDAIASLHLGMSVSKSVSQWHFGFGFIDLLYVKIPLTFVHNIHYRTLGHLWTLGHMRTLGHIGTFGHKGTFGHIGTLGHNRTLEYIFRRTLTHRNIWHIGTLGHTETWENLKTWAHL